MDPLALVRLPDLMALSRGRADLVIGLLDGPVALDDLALAAGEVRTLDGSPGTCRDPWSASCRHGTVVAGMLTGRRGGHAPAIAPDCSLLVRPIFSETWSEEPPSASAGELAAAILDCVDEGARILNVSAALSGEGDAGVELEQALGYAVSRGVLVVAAAGNQGGLAGSVITRHPWVIPVVAYDRRGQPLAQSNLGQSIGRRGLGAPGEAMTSLAPEAEPTISTGTSIAAPVVTGAAALLWSMFPAASAVEVKHALLSAAPGRRGTLAPPLLDAWRAYEVLSEPQARRAVP